MVETGMQAFSVQKITNGLLTLQNSLPTVSFMLKAWFSFVGKNQNKCKLATKMHIDILHRSNRRERKHKKRHSLSKSQAMYLHIEVLKHVSENLDTGPCILYVLQWQPIAGVLHE